MKNQVIERLAKILEDLCLLGLDGAAVGVAEVFDLLKDGCGGPIDLPTLDNAA